MALIRPDTVVLSWLLALPFFAAICTELFPRLTLRVRSEQEAESLRRGPFLLGALASLMGLLLAGALLIGISPGRPAVVDFWWTRDFYHMRFQADLLSAALSAVVCAVGVLLHTLLAGVPALSHPHHRASLLLAAQGCALGACLSADLILLFFFLQATLVCLWGLVFMDGARSANQLLATVYLGSLVFLMGALLIWRRTADSSLAALPLLLVSAEPNALRVMALLVLLGILPKIASVPGHGWLPNLAGSVPFQAAAPCVLLPIVGGAALLRLLPASFMPASVSALGVVALFLGVVSLWWGAVRAWMAPTLRQLAAWLTVAQSGHLLIAVGASMSATAPSDITSAAILQLAVAPLALAVVWVGAGVIRVRFGTDALADLAGTAVTGPLALLALLAGGLSLAGVPPLPGFWVERLLVSGLIRDGHLWFSIVILGADLLIALAVLDAGRRMLPRREPAAEPRWGSLCLSLSAALGIAMLLAAGLAGPQVAGWAQAVVRNVISISMTSSPIAP